MKIIPYLFAAGLAGACAAAWAAAPAARFPVSAKQMQAMGITVQALRRDAAPVIGAVAGRVVLPVAGERVLSAPLAGLAVQVLVQPNQQVARGAPLVRIASAELGALQLQLIQAASRAGLARETLAREQSLFDEGIVPARRLQEAKAAQAEARAALAQARGALRLAGMANGAIDRVAAGGPPEDGVTISAPQAGVVTAIEVRPGQRVDPAAPLLHLARTDRLELELDVPAADAGRWQAGQRLSLQGRGGSAVVSSVGAVVAGGSQTLSVRARVETGSGALRAGELVTVLAPQGGQGAGWDLPLAALAHQGREAYVFVRTADGFEARPVRQLAAAGQRVRVEGKLAEGEQVAVSGVVALKGSWLGEKGGE